VLIFYLSNRKNKVNKWCAIAGFLFWLGIAKEAVMYSVLPALERANETAVDLQGSFMPLYSVCTWALYSLAMPTTIIFALYLGGFNNQKPTLMRLFKILIYFPAVVLSFCFPPHIFREYQMTSFAFWVSFAIYNILLCALLVFLMVRAVRSEKPGKSKHQKMRVVLVILPPVIFWTVSVFITHLFQVSSLFKLWQVNVFIVFAGIIFLLFMAFRDGFMGLRLISETYNWNADKNFINTGAEYTSHMLKTQTAKMELCMENIKSQYLSQNGSTNIPEEFNIFFHSITTLKNYMERMKRHSQTITLIQEPCRITELLTAAMPQNPDITIENDAGDNIFWICDRSHMTEVFSNILTNATEAIRTKGVISITGVYEKTAYCLSFKDNGSGIDDDVIKNIFEPYFTMKSTEKNFGLGLTYCKNVIEKHGGSIKAKSIRGSGTTITILFPLKRVSESGAGE
jgi:two-component sensor histidine kinase